MRTPRRAPGAAALAVLGLLVMPALPGVTGGLTLAHAQLVASSPAAGTVLPASPSELRLAFSEPLESALTSLDVVGQDGTALIDHGGEVDPDDPYALVVTDPKLPDGVYSLTWRTLSAADGHTAEGFFTFGVGDVADDLPPIAGGTTHSQNDPAAVAGRWLTYIGLLLALGVATFHRFVVRAGPMPIGLVRLLAAALAASAIATVGVALFAALETGDPGSYLFGGRNGLLQLARAAVAGGGAALLLVVPVRLAGAIAALAGLGGIVLLVTAGHAAALAGPAPVVGGIVHVAAAAVWIGGVAGLLLLVVRPRMVDEHGPPSIRDMVPRISALALVAVGLVALTGVYSSWAQTGAVLALGTEYGRTVALKSAVAVAAIGIGAVNYVDGGRGRAWLGGLLTRLRAELAAVGVVLLLTAILANTPPVDQARGVAIEPIPDVFGSVQPDMGMEIGPGRPGVNRVIVTTTDAMASAAGLVLVVDRVDGSGSSRIPLTLAGLEGMEGMEGMDHAGMTDRNPDGTVDWYADAIVLPAESSWDTSVLVLADSGAELARQRFAFSLDAEGVDEGRLDPLASVGTVIALLLVVIGALGLGLGLGSMALPRCDPSASRVALLGGGTVAVLLGAVIGAALLFS